MELSSKIIAALKSLIVKSSTDGGMALRVSEIENVGGLIPGANSQSARSFEALVQLCIVKDSENRNALRLVTEKAYKTYTVRLAAQASTTAPAGTVLGVSELGTAVIAYVSAGLYTITFTGNKLTANKTFVNILLPGTTAEVTAKAAVADLNVVQLRSFDSGTLANDILPVNTLVEIRVYR